MPLVRLPTPCTLRDIFAADGHDPATFTGPLDAGLTKAPTGFVVPTFQITERRTDAAQTAAMRQAFNAKVLPPPPRGAPPVRPGGPSAGEWLAQLTVTRHANEGTNTSLYVKKGVHETNFTFNVEKYKAAKSDPENGPVKPGNWLEPWQNARQPRVYVVMPEPIAEINRKLEIEHCDDFVTAYDLTLGALEAALAHVAATVSPIYASAQLARDARLHLLHAALPVGLKDVVQNPDLCGQKYIDLGKKTEIRDSSDWHSLALDYLGPGPPPPSIHYLTDRHRPESGCIFLQFTQGTAEFGKHPSASIIKF